MQLKGKLGAIWAIVGVSLILGDAIVRVSPKVVDALKIGLSPWQWVILVMWVVFMLISEGYNGFQKQFSPRVAARMWHLYQHGRIRDLLLAPLYCMGYYGATKRRIITSWTLTAGIVLIIVIVLRFEQPWRGIVDSGVVLGMIYGLMWVYICTWQTIKKRGYIVDPEVAEVSSKFNL